MTSSDALSLSATGSVSCKPERELLYEDAGFSSFTEDRIRAAGILSFESQPKDKLSIYDLDSADFGEIVRNEDGSYFTLNLPQEIVARWMVPQDEFSTFNFDAEPVDSSGEYLEIYLNGGKRLVKKSGLVYTFSTWTEYIMARNVKLKSCNLLKNAAGKSITFSKDQIFEVIGVKGDLIQLKSSKACVPDGIEYREMEGWLKWRSGDDLVVNFTTCN
jgi:hypothetical protein